MSSIFVSRQKKCYLCKFTWYGSRYVFLKYESA